MPASPSSASMSMSSQASSPSGTLRGIMTTPLCDVLTTLQHKLGIREVRIVQLYHSEHSEKHFLLPGCWLLSEAAWGGACCSAHAQCQIFCNTELDACGACSLRLNS